VAQFRQVSVYSFAAHRLCRYNLILNMRYAIGTIAVTLVSGAILIPDVILMPITVPGIVASKSDQNRVGLFIMLPPKNFE